MSQVRLDEVLLNDPRFRDLVGIIQERTDLLTRDEAEEMAVGKCWRAYLLSQRYWRDNRRLIPKEVWTRKSCSSFTKLLLQVGLAEDRPDGVYICGAREYFDWYHAKVESGRKGGIESGKSRSKTKQNRSGASSASKQRFEADEADGRSNEPVMLCSVSVSDSVSKEKSNPPAAPSSPDPVDLSLADDWILFAKTRSDTAKPDRDKYVDAMRQMRRLGLTPGDITATLDWIKRDEFWSKVAWSPVQLVKAKGGVRKLDNVRAQMAKRSHGDPPRRNPTPIVSSLEELDALSRG